MVTGSTVDILDGESFHLAFVFCSLFSFAGSKAPLLTQLVNHKKSVAAILHCNKYAHQTQLSSGM